MKLFLSLEFALFPKKKILTVEKFNIDLCSNMKKISTQKFLNISNQTVTVIRRHRVVGFHFFVN